MSIYFDYCDLAHACFGFELTFNGIFLVFSARRPNLPPTVDPLGPRRLQVNHDNVLASHGRL